MDQALSPSQSTKRMLKCTIAVLIVIQIVLIENAVAMPLLKDALGRSLVSWNYVIDEDLGNGYERVDRFTNKSDGHDIKLERIDILYLDPAELGYSDLNSSNYNDMRHAAKQQYPLYPKWGGNWFLTQDPADVTWTNRESSKPFNSLVLAPGEYKDVTHIARNDHFGLSDVNIGIQADDIGELAVGFRYSGEVTKKPPNIFGLYIGIDDTNCFNCLGGSDNANAVMNTVVNGYQNADIGDQRLLTGSTDANDGLSFFDIFNAIKDVSSGMNDDDVFLLYISGHGGDNFFPNGGETTLSAGDEVIQIGDYTSSENLNDLLFDDELSAMLSYGGVVGKEKLVILDSCHSGGFWGDGGEDPLLGKDLSQVPNTTLLAAATENTTGHYNPYTGRSSFSLSIEEALSTGMDGFAEADANGDGEVTAAELGQYVIDDRYFTDTPIVGVTGLAIDDVGRTISANEQTWAPQYFTNSESEIYLSSTPRNSVPTPSTFGLLIFGLLSLSYFRTYFS